jgi:uncharacterized membrane protein YphA (DoxX/SURF4 family)
MKKFFALIILLFIVFTNLIITSNGDYKKELIVEHLDSNKSYLIIAFLTIVLASNAILIPIILLTIF